MVDYQKMYFRLFDAATKAIEVLQQAQRDMEEIYISVDESGLTLIGGKKDKTQALSQQNTVPEK
ncbi:MAG: hypothetical protein ACYCX2_02165 [Christensenellales bacterium]